MLAQLRPVFSHTSLICESCVDLVAMKREERRGCVVREAQDLDPHRNQGLSQVSNVINVYVMVHHPSSPVFPAAYAVPRADQGAAGLGWAIPQEIWPTPVADMDPLAAPGNESSWGGRGG